MKILISAVLALSLLGVAGAANAAPFHGTAHGPAFHREMVRFAPRHVWMRGERFVPGYGRFTVIENWRAFRLPPPAFGAHWVRVGGDILLVGNRNGMILNVMLGRY